MWELVSFMLALAAFFFIVNYMFEPKQLIEDIRGLKQSDSRIDELEKRVAELEKLASKEQ